MKRWWDGGGNAGERNQNSEGGGRNTDKRAKEDQERKGLRNYKNSLLSAENWGDPVKKMTGNSTFLGHH